MRDVVFVGLNPVVLVFGLGGDHNDFLMVFCIVLGFYLLLRSGTAWRERPARGPGGRGCGCARLAAAALARWRSAPGMAFVTAAAIKASGAVLIPVVLAALLRAPRRLVQVAARDGRGGRRGRRGRA